MKEIEITVEDQAELKEQKVVRDPRLSLKQFSQYMTATERGKSGVLRKCKYPGTYIPRFYEMARKLVCETFSANFEDHDLYFEEFKRQAAIFREEAKGYPENKDNFKNRVSSARGLDEICNMEQSLTPVLRRYVLENNLSKRRDTITRNGVKIGAVADMIVSENGGATQVGFLKFNFTTQLLSKKEAGTMLHVLKEFFEKKDVNVDPKSCFLIDVFAARIYTLSGIVNMEQDFEKATLEIRKNWDLI